MANDGAAQLTAVAVRVARLAADGSTPAGAGNLYVTNTVVKVTPSPEYETGDDIVLKNGQGQVCLAVKIPDVMKRITLTVEVCAFDPELTEILSGGSVITASGSTVGYAYEAIGTDPVPNGVSLEVWTRRYVNSVFAGYAWWVFPKVYLHKTDRDLSISPQSNSFEGFGVENPSWGNGPNNDWTAPSVRAAQWVQAATAPTGSTGYASTPTQV